MIKKSTKKKKTAAKKPGRRYVRKITYYVAVDGAKAPDSLPPQPRLMVETIKQHGRVERSAFLKELAKKLNTKQPIPRLFSFHKSALIKARFFKEVKEPVTPTATVKSTKPATVAAPTPKVKTAVPTAVVATASEAAPAEVPVSAPAEAAPVEQPVT